MTSQRTPNLTHHVMFSWDIGPTCQLETDRSKTSEVEVRFTAESGWPLYLGRYLDLLSDGDPR